MILKPLIGNQGQPSLTATAAAVQDYCQAATNFRLTRHQTLSWLLAATEPREGVPISLHPPSNHGIESIIDLNFASVMVAMMEDGGYMRLWDIFGCTQSRRPVSLVWSCSLQCDHWLSLLVDTVSLLLTVCQLTGLSPTAHHGWLGYGDHGDRGAHPPRDTGPLRWTGQLLTRCWSSGHWVHANTAR